MPDPTRTLAARAIPLRGPAFASAERVRADEIAHFSHWQALVDAGLIGHRPPVSPEIVARRDATDALFRSFARGRGL